MKKRLIYVTHGEMDGNDKVIGPGGLDYARAVGLSYRAMRARFDIALVFHGPHVCTAQTAASFIAGHGHVGGVAPIVPQIGIEELLSEIYSPTFQALANSGGNIHAVLACHALAKVEGWAETARGGVSQMFAQLAEGQLGVAFGHGPVIDLAVCSILGTYDLPPKYFSCYACEGVDLVCDPNGRVKVLGKISAL